MKERETDAPQTIRGISPTAVFIDESDFFDINAFKTVVLPLLLVKGMCVVMATTLNNAPNVQYQKMFSDAMMSNGANAFNEFTFQFICPACKVKGNTKCPHDEETRPDWNPDENRERVQFMLRHDEETYAIEVDARGPARSPQIIDQRFVDRLFNEVSHPTMNLDSPNFQPPYVFISIDPNTGRLIDRNAPSFSNYALVSFYSVPGGPYVLLGAEDIDCGDVNQYLPKIIDHVKRLYNLPALRYSKFVVITENRTGHESTRLREDFVRCGFQNMYMLQLGINMRQGIPMNEEIKRSCIFNLASVFENDRLYFDRDFFSVHAETLHADVLGSLTPAMFVKREMKKQFENFRAVRKASTEIGVEPRIKYTGKISPNSRDDIFMATAIGMYYAMMFERDDRFENLRI